MTATVPFLPVKPAYRVPSMAEIAAVPPSGRRLVSTFSGCGGSCLGFRMAGFEVLWASEFVPAARETYAVNASPKTILDARDLRAVDPAEILAAIGLRRGEVDVLEGSPPCASFSTAGKRHAGWGQVRKYSDVRQRTDDLFFEFARILDGVSPKVFVAENVSGLVKGTAKGYFKEILRALRAVGYRVECRVLDAQWLGVPQARQRAIFVGIREDLGADPEFPSPLPHRYSVADACPWIGSLRHDSMGQEGSRVFDVVEDPLSTVRAAGGGAQTGFLVGVGGQRAGDLLSVEDPSPTVMAAGIGGVGPHQQLVRTDRFAIGREMRKLRPGEASDRYFNLVRARSDRPSPTVTAEGGNPGAAAVVHPTEQRKFTIAELRRLCGFPDDFVLTGSYSKQWERLGRAVPPVMMSHVARAVLGTLDRVDPR